MQDSKILAVGDKVRVKEPSRFAGFEGTVKYLSNPYDSSIIVTVTKSLLDQNPVGSEIRPYSSSLEPLWEPAVGGLVPVVDLDAASMVVHPAHYGGDTVYEVIKVAEAWGLDKDAYLFNVIKYVGRAGKKAKSTLMEDLKKARFYLDRRIKALEGELSTTSS